MGFKYKFDSPLDAPERTLEHKKIILSKPFLKRLYVDWYKQFESEMSSLPNGDVIELGSGGGFLKDVIPTVISSDILPLSTNDMTFSALDMPFEANSISGLLMVDTFHHIPDAFTFLKEAERVLQKDGKIIMIEPANSAWGRFIFKTFHHEPYDLKGTWQIPSSGPLSGANIPLPWIVFIRDSELFKKEFPGFEIEEIKYHTAFGYLISGGVSFKSLVPNFSYSFFKKTDQLLARMSKQLSMFMTIKIKKIN